MSFSHYTKLLDRTFIKKLDRILFIREYSKYDNKN